MPEKKQDAAKYKPPVSLAPLSLDEAIDGLLQVDASKIEKLKGKKKAAGMKKKADDKK